MEKRPTSSRRPRTPKKTASGNGKRIALGFLIILLVMVTGIGCGFLTASMNTKPDLAHDILPPASSHIYDTNGNEIANIHADENREPVKIAQVPKDLQNAFVAVEDNRFYDHMGVDPRGIARAIYANLRGRTVTEDPEILREMRERILEELAKECAEKFMVFGITPSQAARLLLELDKEKEES